MAQPVGNVQEGGSNGFRMSEISKSRLLQQIWEKLQTAAGRFLDDGALRLFSDTCTSNKQATGGNLHAGASGLYGRHARAVQSMWLPPSWWSYICMP